MIRNKEPEKKIRDSASAVSEIIGAILLISVVVLAVAIIAVGLFSQPLPQKIPDSRFITEINSSTNSLTIYHDGGEPLYRGEFTLRINGVNIKDDAYTLNPGGGNIWSVGKSLVLPNVSGSSNVQIFYNTGSGEVLLDQVRLQPGQTIVPDVYVNPAPVCPACNISGCNQSVIGDAFTQIVSNTSIVFMRADSKTELDNNGILTFKVTNTSSVLSIEGKPLINLAPGDIVTISLSSNSKDFKAFGLGDKFYHLRGDGVNIQLSSPTNPSKNFNDNNAVLENGWITGYIDLGSTFTIDSPDPGPQEAYTLLVVNGTPIINGDSRQQITISNIRPIGVGLFLLEEDSNSKEGVNFVGFGSIA